jgi:hypothetical protein
MSSCHPKVLVGGGVDDEADIRALRALAPRGT